MALPALPLAGVLSGALAKFAGWLAAFLGSWLLMAIFGFLAEALPRLLGLGQGLISWGFGVAASASFEAFRLSMSLAGVEVPSFMELLSGLPPELLWAGSAMRVHKAVFIFASLPAIKLLRKALEGVAASAAGSGASSLMGGSK